MTTEQTFQKSIPCNPTFQQTLKDLAVKFKLEPGGAPPPEPVCAICGDTGVFSGYKVYVNGSRNIVYNEPCPAKSCPYSAIAAARIQQEKVNRMFDGTQIPVRFQSATLDTVLQSNQLIKQAADALRERHNLILIGDPGTGKTFFACALVRTLLQDSQQCLFVGVPDLLDKIRRGFNAADGNKSEDILEAAAASQWLVLDDIGKEKPTTWVLETLYRLVNKRYGDMLPTIVTSNLDFDGLMRQLDASTVSRLLEGAVVLTFDSADRRIK